MNRLTRQWTVWLENLSDRNVSRCPDLPREVLFSVANFFMCCVFVFQGWKNISRIVCALTRKTKYFLNDLRKCILAYTRISSMKIDFPFLPVAPSPKFEELLSYRAHEERQLFKPTSTASFDHGKSNTWCPPSFSIAFRPWAVGMVG